MQLEATVERRPAAEAWRWAPESDLDDATVPMPTAWTQEEAPTLAEMDAGAEAADWEEDLWRAELDDDWEEQDLWRAEQGDDAEARMDQEAEAAGELPEFDMPDMDDECTQPRTADEDDQLQTEPMEEGNEAPQQQETESGDDIAAAASAGAMQTPSRGERAPTGATDARDDAAAATDARDVGSGRHLHTPHSAAEGGSSESGGSRQRPHARRGTAGNEPSGSGSHSRQVSSAKRARRQQQSRPSGSR